MDIIITDVVKFKAITDDGLGVNQSRIIGRNFGKIWKEELMDQTKTILGSATQA